MHMYVYPAICNFCFILKAEWHKVFSYNTLSLSVAAVGADWKELQNAGSPVNSNQILFIRRLDHFSFIDFHSVIWFQENRGWVWQPLLSGGFVYDLKYDNSRCILYFITLKLSSFISLKTSPIITLQLSSFITCLPDWKILGRANLTPWLL